MKKIIALVVSLLLLAAPISSLADEKEIKFRGTEWGMTFPEVKNILGMDGINLTWGFDNYHKNLDSLIFQNSDSFDQAAVFSKSTFLLNDLVVAGYAVDDISAYFSYRENETTEKQPSEEDSVFFAASYQFANIVDFDSTFNDLINKLSYIYGEANETRKKTIVIGYIWYIWYDANGNGIALEHEKYNDAVQEITLWYFSANADTLIKESYNLVKAQALAEEAKKYGLDNLDGL